MDRFVYPSGIQTNHSRLVELSIKNKGLILNGWVLMTNHLHFAGRCEEPHRMSDFLRDFKKYTSKALANAVLTTPESRREWLMDKFARFILVANEDDKGAYFAPNKGTSQRSGSCDNLQYSGTGHAIRII